MNVSNLVDALYERLILRDLVAKVLPGSLLFAAIASMLTGHSVENIVVRMTNEGWFAILLSASASWTLAFIPQTGWEMFTAFGRWRELGQGEREWGFQLWPRLIVQRRAESMDRFAQPLERMAIIKEATGNLSLSTLAAGLLLKTTRASLLESATSQFGRGEALALSVLLALLLARCVFAIFQELAIQRQAVTISANNQPAN